MLYSLIFLSFLFPFNELFASCPQKNTCPTALPEDFIRDSLKSVEALKQNKDFQSFLSHSFEQREAVLKSSDFQDVVTDLQKPLIQISKKKQTLSTLSNLYIFVSLSMGEKALLNLAREANQYGAILALRGFVEGSFLKTAQTLQTIIQETGQGFIIDPDLFSLFEITSVPTYVLSQPFQLSSSERSQTPLHDRLIGHVSVRYALEVFSRSGDLKEGAQALLNRRRA